MTSDVRRPSRVAERRVARRSSSASRGQWQRPRAADSTSRVAFAAAHVVADPRGENVPGAPAVVDWDSTLAFRRAPVRATASASPRRWTPRSATWAWTGRPCRSWSAAAPSRPREHGARIASGAGTDHARPRAADARRGRGGLRRAGRRTSRATGSQVILMASRAAGRGRAASPTTTSRCTTRCSAQVDEPVILHWLGEVFDPQLRGYWGCDRRRRGHGDVPRPDPRARRQGRRRQGLAARRRARDRPAGRASRRGAPLHRRRLQLPRADPRRRHAPLGRAARRLRRDRPGGLGGAARRSTRATCATYDAEMAPTLPLSRHVFEAPTYYYKTGIAFLSWLSGHQPGFTMVGGLQSARSAVHLAGSSRLADDARLLPDPDLAAHRLRVWLDGAGLADDRRRRGARRPLGAPARVATPAPGDPRLARLSLNQKTVDGWTLREAIDGCVATGLPAIGVWREPVAEVGLDDGRPLAARRRAAGLLGLPRRLLHRVGDLAAAERHDDNRRALDEAAALGAPCLVLVPGGLPAGDRDLRGCPCASRGRGRGARPARPRASASASPSSRCTRSSPPTAASSPRSARPSTSPSRCPSRRSASSSTRSTSGGSPASRSRSPGPATASRATRSASGSPRYRPTRCSPAG